MTDPPAALPAPEPATGPPFFPVSASKLAVLSICSFGLYQAYWFYRNWRLALDARRIWSLPAAILAPLTAYWLFKRVRATLGQHNLPGVTAGGLAALYAALTASGLWLPDPWRLAVVLSVVPLVVVQARVNRLNTRVAPDTPRNARHSLGNVAVIVLGALVWFLVLLYHWPAAPGLGGR
ncbi:MAG: hypothetical protein ACREMF_02725 [Gemmatimonadales bacterium]